MVGVVERLFTFVSPSVRGIPTAGPQLALDAVSHHSHTMLSSGYSHTRCSCPTLLLLTLVQLTLVYPALVYLTMLRITA